jgi:toxin ParE1/3/4
VKVSYRQAARDDLIRQFRYYLVTVGRPAIALRFRDAVGQTVAMLRKRPLVGARYDTDDQRLRNLRSWPVKGFEAIRVYYLSDESDLQIVRILHVSRDVRRILENHDPR